MRKVSFFLLVFSFCLAILAISCEEEEELTIATPDTTQADPPNTSDDTDTGSSDADGSNTDTPDPEETGSDEAISYLALGDSYTIGQSVTESERYPELIVKELKKEGIEIQSPEIIAATGWTTENLQRGIANAAIEGKNYDLVSLLIGVNNQYQGRSSAEYEKDFKELLLQSIDFANGDKGKVFVISIPDYGYTPFGASNREEISPEINEFNALNKKITASLGVQYFDITPISRNGLSEPSLVASDGLHPSGKMYQQWVDLMLAEVLTMAKTP